MRSQLSIRGVEIGLITTGPGDRIRQIVWGEDLRDSLKEFESMHVGLNPGGEIRIQARLAPHARRSDINLVVVSTPNGIPASATFVR